MSTLAAMNFSEFLGTIWFSALTLVVGWVGGNIFPMASLTNRFRK
jgi:hypothetical protein